MVTSVASGAALIFIVWVFVLLDELALIVPTLLNVTLVAPFEFDLPLKNTNVLFGILDTVIEYVEETSELFVTYNVYSSSSFGTRLILAVGILAETSHLAIVFESWTLDNCVVILEKDAIEKDKQKETIKVINSKSIYFLLVKLFFIL